MTHEQPDHPEDEFLHLTRTVEIQADTIYKLNNTIEELREKIEEQENQKKRKEQFYLEETERFETLQRDYHKLQLSYQDIYREYSNISNAFFWKITKPCRITIDKLKYVFRNNRAMHQVWSKLKKIKNGVNGQKGVEPDSTSEFYHLGDPIYILCTKHTLFIGKLFENALEKLGIVSKLMTEEPKDFTDDVYIVICAQIFKKLPNRYIAVQMEQTVSFRWLSEEYYERLRHAHSILDYSLVNIRYFRNNSDFGKNFYYLPIDYLPHLHREAKKYAYDVAFYGDVNCPRRVEILKQIQKHFSVLIIDHLFDKDLYDKLCQAKIVLNIHYYENALLETTRIYEILSLGCSIVISERSSNAREEERLESIVDFVPLDDINAMINRIGYWLSHEEERKNMLFQNNETLSKRSNAFEYFFNRYMLANDWLEFEDFYRLSGDYVSLESNRICLSLPESVERREDFDKDNKYGFQVIPGLRHQKSWIGCGLSYKFLMKKAEQQKLEEVIICEDDVLFPDDFEQKLEQCTHYLFKQPEWDIFQGLMADVGDVNISRVDQYGDGEYFFVHLDHMISTVFNIYHRNIYERFICWDENNEDVHTNTIDRALESKKLKIITTVPFLVGHKEDLCSEIWEGDNSIYHDLILNSSKKLERKIKELTVV